MLLPCLPGRQMYTQFVLSFPARKNNNARDQVQQITSVAVHTWQKTCVKVFTSYRATGR